MSADLLAHDQLAKHQDPKALLCIAGLQLFGPSAYWHMRLFLHRYRTLHFPLLNFTKFLLCLVLQPLMVPYSSSHGQLLV